MKDKLFQILVLFLFSTVVISVGDVTIQFEVMPLPDKSEVAN